MKYSLVLQIHERNSNLPYRAEYTPRGVSRVEPSISPIVQHSLSAVIWPKTLEPYYYLAAPRSLEPRKKLPNLFIPEFREQQRFMVSNQSLSTCVLILPIASFTSFHYVFGRVGLSVCLSVCLQTTLLKKL